MVMWLTDFLSSDNFNVILIGYIHLKLCYIGTSKKLKKRKYITKKRWYQNDGNLPRIGWGPNRATRFNKPWESQLYFERNWFNITYKTTYSKKRRTRVLISPVRGWWLKSFSIEKLWNMLQVPMLTFFVKNWLNSYTNGRSSFTINPCVDINV